MPWAGLLRVAQPGARGYYRNLVMKVEDSSEPGWLIRLYEGETVVAEAREADPQEAFQKLLILARERLHEESITEESFAWIRVTDAQE